ncbi:hypothetical protein PInf_009928 [Phytophthora infestans]|nr:hypothetical protein PInf_009928 [Phytophthora infestans]
MAVEHERHFQQNKRMRVGQQGRTKKKVKTAEQRSNGKESQPNAKEGAQEKKKRPQLKHNKKFDKKTDRKVRKSAAPTKVTRDPPSPCPKCNVMHWLSDCPKATEEEKVTLCEKLRQETKARKSHTGLDNTVISQPHWDLLRAADPTVQAEILDTPVRSITYGGHTVVANQKVVLHILTHSAAGAKEPAEPVPCLLVNSSDSEVIIGRDLLGALGIDVDRQLEMIAGHGEDETSGDPFNLEADGPPANSNKLATDEEFRAAVENLIERALEHEFPAD